MSRPLLGTTFEEHRATLEAGPRTWTRCFAFPPDNIFDAADSEAIVNARGDTGNLSDLCEWMYANPVCRFYKTYTSRGERSN